MSENLGDECGEDGARLRGTFDPFTATDEQLEELTRGTADAAGSSPSVVRGKYDASEQLYRQNCEARAAAEQRLKAEQQVLHRVQLQRSREELGLEEGEDFSGEFDTTPGPARSKFFTTPHSAEQINNNHVHDEPYA